ncbi:hypothetical protein [Amycolatopsis viridis]|uniref:Secreted protein n=1 Tax=Amycolatopsis viridis TaxID=185678 RepID=A0ABX0SR12_9PSEU|nr:hypothetical protein [Amycolatopsis viridis]NIH78973.1 hypothetical protein [Amycolatopsis viridis]
MNNRTVVSAGLAVAALLIVSALLGGWVALVVVIVLLGIGGVALAAAYSRPRIAPPAPAPAVMSAEYEISAEPLQTADPDYRAFFSAQVHCQFTAGPGARDAASWAVRSIRDRAADIVARYQPEDLAQAQRDLAVAVGQALGDSASRWAWATQVTLTLSDDDRELVQRRIELRKKVRQWEDERALEKALRAYLRDDALATPSDALIWWLAQNQDRVEDAVRMRGTFALLSSAVHESAVSPYFAGLAAEAEPSDDRQQAEAVRDDRPSSPADLADRFVRALHPATEEKPERELLRDRLASLMVRAGRPDLAGSLRDLGEGDVPDNVTALR